MLNEFQPGDRVKCVNAQSSNGRLTTGAIYTIASNAMVSTPRLVGVPDSNDCGSGYARNRFELYAKAGTFVAGDRVVALINTEHGCWRLREGDVYTVRSFNNSGWPVLTSDPADDIIPCTPGKFRLATPEEIAAADAPPPKRVPLTLPGRDGPHHFRVGDKVLCLSNDGNEDLLNVGRQYVVCDARGLRLSLLYKKQLFFPRRFELIEDKDGWRPWAGGYNPVPGNKVLLKFKNRREQDNPCDADSLTWQAYGGPGEIVAYRVAESITSNSQKLFHDADMLHVWRPSIEIGFPTWRALIAEPEIDVSKIKPGDIVIVRAEVRSNHCANGVYLTSTDVRVADIIDHEPRFKVGDLATLDGDPVTVKAVGGESVCVRDADGELVVVDRADLDRAA